jgi:hypothetical protein
MSLNLQELKKKLLKLLLVHLALEPLLLQLPLPLLLLL